jgi:hypothetical protein
MQKEGREEGRPETVVNQIKDLHNPCYNIWIQDSAVGIATGYGLNDRRVVLRVPIVSRIFISPVVQTGSGVHPTSNPIGRGGGGALSLGV